MLGSQKYVFLVRHREMGRGRRIREASRRGCLDPEMTFSLSGRGKRAADAEVGVSRQGCRDAEVTFSSSGRGKRAADAALERQARGILK